MGIGQIEGPKNGCWPYQRDCNMGIEQNDQTKIWFLARPISPKNGYQPDKSDIDMGISQTEQTKT